MTLVTLTFEWLWQKKTICVCGHRPPSFCLSLPHKHTFLALSSFSFSLNKCKQQTAVVRETLHSFLSVTLYSYKQPMPLLTELKKVPLHLTTSKKFGNLPSLGNVCQNWLQSIVVFYKSILFKKHYKRVILCFSKESISRKNCRYDTSHVTLFYVAFPNY